jgi:hypothetical protein
MRKCDDWLCKHPFSRLPPFVTFQSAVLPRAQPDPLRHAAKGPPAARNVPSSFIEPQSVALQI